MSFSPCHSSAPLMNVPPVSGFVGKGRVGRVMHLGGVPHLSFIRRNCLRENVALLEVLDPERKYYVGSNPGSPITHGGLWSLRAYEGSSCLEKGQVAFIGSSKEFPTLKVLRTLRADSGAVPALDIIHGLLPFPFDSAPSSVS